MIILPFLLQIIIFMSPSRLKLANSIRGHVVHRAKRDREIFIIACSVTLSLGKIVELSVVMIRHVTSSWLFLCLFHLSRSMTVTRHARLVISMGITFIQQRVQRCFPRISQLERNCFFASCDERNEETRVHSQ